MAERSDQQLIARFRKGDDTAFDAIYDRYRPMLLRYARRVLGGGAEHAEDVVQEGMWRAARALRRRTVSRWGRVSRPMTKPFGESRRFAVRAQSERRCCWAAAGAARTASATRVVIRRTATTLLTGPGASRGSPSGCCR